MRKTKILKNPPAFISYASAAGYEEHRGPLGCKFDFHDETDLFGSDSWEKAEGELAHTVLSLALKKGGISEQDVEVLFAGDLQNQCVASSSGLYNFGIPYLGLYGACSTCTEALLLSSLYLETSEGDTIAAAVTSSHYCAAERQFRTPLEYGGQRTPTAQWTATAAGAFLLGRKESGVRITEIMPGKMIDSGICDASNMGAAMAPAAADSVFALFSDEKHDISSFDRIVTGDLGDTGSFFLHELLSKDGIDIRDKHEDCGLLLYDRNAQDVHSGASGCGCSASVLAAHYLPMLEKRELKKILFMSTGALMSPSSVQQRIPIFGICPAVVIESD